MNCDQCQKETICTYGIIGKNPPNVELYFCSRKCVDAYHHEHGYPAYPLSADEQRIAELEDQVAELQAQVATLTGRSTAE
jgi:hypothetical protein